MNPRKAESKARVKSVTLKDGSILTYQSEHNNQVTVRHQWASGYQMLTLDACRWSKMR